MMQKKEKLIILKDNIVNFIKCNKVVLFCVICHTIMSSVWSLFVFASPFKSLETFFIFCVSKMISIIVMYYIWKLIFFIAGRKLYKKYIIISIIMLFFCMLLLISSFPGSFYIEIDNLANFFASLEFRPTYWHSMYIGCYYAACMMVCPHPIFIQICQLLLFISMFMFVYINLEKLVGRKVNFLFLLFLNKGLYYILLNPYRNCLFTIFAMYMLADTVFPYFLKQKNIFSVFCRRVIIYTFAGVFRPEGIFFSFILLGIHIFVLCNQPILKKIKYCILCLLIFFIFFNMHNIGFRKSYGDSYKIVSCMEQLQNILNSDKLNLSYEDAEKDLENINVVVPIEYIKSDGLTGYRNYNAEQGRENFNISGANKEECRRFFKSYIRIVLNNLKPFIKFQLALLNNATGLNFPHARIYNYDGDFHSKPFWEIVNHNNIVNNRLKTFNKYKFDNFYLNKLNRILSIFIDVYNSVSIISLLYKIISYGLIVRIILEVNFFIVLVVLFSNNTKNLIQLIFLMAIISMFCIVFLTMPEGRPAYFYPTFFCMNLYAIIFPTISFYRNGV